MLLNHFINGYMYMDLWVYTYVCMLCRCTYKLGKAKSKFLSQKQTFPGGS